MQQETLYLEKRKFVRYQLKARGEMLFADGSSHHGEFHDISVAGAFFSVNHIDQGAVNQFVTISMNVEIDGQLRNLLAQCKIVRVTDSGVGMLLGKMNEESKSTFHALMKTLRDNLIKD